MFEEVLGIPAHPLLVHAAVVFVPLQVLFAIAYAFLPRLRPKITWAVVALTVIGPIAAWFAKLSGQAFRARLVENGLTDATFLGKIDAHQDFGDATAWATLVLSALTIILMLVQRRATGDAAYTGGNAIVGWILKILLLGIALATGYYVFRTGDSGAHIVWEGQ